MDEDNFEGATEEAMAEVPGITTMDGMVAGITVTVSTPQGIEAEDLTAHDQVRHTRTVDGFATAAENTDILPATVGRYQRNGITVNPFHLTALQKTKPAT